jgi:RHS repeat-associated protein
LLGRATKSESTHTYTYDAENRITQVDSGTTASYAYMPEGRRATKISAGSTRDYVYDLSDSVIAEMTSSGWQVGDVYLGGQMIAEYKNSTAYFVHQDHLGSTRLVTGLNQAALQNLDYFPYGELNSTNSYITTHEFTGDERDAESGLDHTQFRQYSSSMARWMTPDPAGLAAVDPSNPQSWNRYAYVLNNPLSLVDPFGLSCITTMFVDDHGNEQTFTSDDGDGQGCAAAGVGAGGDSPHFNDITPDPVPVNADPGSILDFIFSPAIPLYIPNDLPLSRFASKVLKTVHRNLRSMNPDFCGYGFFSLTGKEGSPSKDSKVHGGAYVMATHDSKSGNFIGFLVEAGYGPVSVGSETSGNVATHNVDSTTFLMVGGDHLGGFAGYTNSTSPIQLGAYGTFSGWGGGVYANIVPSNGCHN